MDAETLILFRSEVNAQLRQLETVFDRIEQRAAATSETEVESLAYQLHNLYCAFEDLFELVAERFENHLEHDAKYHTALLQRMAMPIEGVRPALLEENTLRLLDNLRGFRHVFRHAYSYTLDKRKVELVLEDTRSLRHVYRDQITSFLNTLDAGAE